MAEIKINKSFANREALDSYIKTSFGENAEKNREIIFEAPEEELMRLSLSENVTVHGVRIKSSKK